MWYPHGYNIDGSPYRVASVVSRKEFKLSEAPLLPIVNHEMAIVEDLVPNLQEILVMCNEFLMEMGNVRVR